MDQRQKNIRIGAAVILCAVALRLFGSGAVPPVSEWLKPNIQSFLIYLETGRIVRFSASTEAVPAFAGESPPPQTEPAPTEPARPAFSAADADALELGSGSSESPDLAELLTRPLNWDLTGGDPTVLILHTHTTESYTKTGEDYEETSAFRTLDEAYNMLSIGDRVAQLLEEGGIGVIHDRSLHDYPSYNGSYNDARKSIAEYLAQYPGICLVLDLHRDASGDIDNQMRTVATVRGETSAQLMLVVGSGSGNGNHPNWEENLSLALKLQTQLERQNPGVCRPINLRSGRFNQDLSTGALLVEVGAAGNTHQEALLAAEALAQGILSLAHGTQPAA